GLGIEFGQFWSNGVIEFADTEKSAVAQRGQNVPLRHLNGRLSLRFVTRLLRSCWDNDRAVMLGHLLIGAMNQRFVAARLADRGLGIVGNQHAADPAKE